MVSSGSNMASEPPFLVLLSNLTPASKKKKRLYELAKTACQFLCRFIL